MMNFFVPTLSEDYSTAKNIRIRDLRLKYYKNILREQFYLSYVGKINFYATDKMNIFERKNLYNILIEQKSKEREEREKAMSKKKENKGSRGRSRPHKRS